MTEPPSTDLSKDEPLKNDIRAIAQQTATPATPLPDVLIGKVNAVAALSLVKK